MEDLNDDLDKYVLENNYFEDQKKKIGVDKYFSDLKSGKTSNFLDCIGLKHNPKLDIPKKWKPLKNG